MFQCKPLPLLIGSRLSNPSLSPVLLSLPRRAAFPEQLESAAGLLTEESSESTEILSLWSPEPPMSDFVMLPSAVRSLPCLALCRFGRQFSETNLQFFIRQCAVCIRFDIESVKACRPLLWWRLSHPVFQIASDCSQVESTSVASGGLQGL